MKNNCKFAIFLPNHDVCDAFWETEVHLIEKKSSCSWKSILLKKCSFPYGELLSPKKRHKRHGWSKNGTLAAESTKKENFQKWCKNGSKSIISGVMCKFSTIRFTSIFWVQKHLKKWIKNPKLASESEKSPFLKKLRPFFKK